MIIEVNSVEAMTTFGQKLGRSLHGGAIIELIGDVGAGKTTLVKGIAAGLGVNEDVQSPSFTIERTYECRDDLVLSHYDFYRLTSAGIMTEELEETLNDPRSVTIIEWAGAVAGILPDDRLSIEITSPTETTRKLSLSASGRSSNELLGEII